MGNNNSSNLKRSAIKNTPEFIQIESNEERLEMLLEYYFSNDAKAIDGLHVIHFIREFIFQSNFSSPIEDKLVEGCKVLDIGCGPGTWLLDLSSKYENSRFFGIDIQSIFPQEIKPNNVEFIEIDVSIVGLPFRDNEFDCTHAELMRLIYTSDRWDFILSELIRVTKPGGYIEVSGRRNENVNRAPIYRKLMDAVNANGLRRNIDINLIDSLESKFELLFPIIENVHRIEKDFIIGPNGGKIGLVGQDLALINLKSETAIKTMSEEMGISEEEYKSMIEKDLIEEFKQACTETIYVRIWAQKQLS